MPTVVNEGKVTIPVDPAMLNPNPNAVDNCKKPAEADSPTVELPTCKDGTEEVPAGSTSAPVNVPPVKGNSRLEWPVTVAVIVPALKFPLASLLTIVEGLFKLVAVVAELETRPAVESVTSLLFAIVPTVISASTISEVDNNPAAEL